MIDTAQISQKQTKPKQKTKSKKQAMDFGVANISENALHQFFPEILAILLRDRTASYYSKKKKNIIWANDNYAELGQKYGANCQITPDLITGNHGNLIIPRALKSQAKQKERTKSKAEVFTPSWVVKKQNDALDADYKNDDLITYLSRTWLEITCGEAPYIANRYEMATGEIIPLNQRVGFLDRKLQRINHEFQSQSKKNKNEWQQFAKKAFQSAYGFEWNGDSLLLARENLLLTYRDYYFELFNEEPSELFLKQIAEIISYNIFQMDGLTYTIPLSQITKTIVQPPDLFSEKETKTVIKSAGIRIKIKDWTTGKLINFMEQK